MSDKVAVFIVNYNVPERADALFSYIASRTKTPTDIYLIDNCSDLVPPAENTNVWITGRNRQTTGGWLTGLRAAKESGKTYAAYSFLITSADFPADIEQDPITPMLEVLQNDDNAVGVHAALTEDSTTSWAHLITRGGTAPRRTWFLDNIFSMYRSSFFDSIGWFDPDLRYAWGIDLETCYKARQQGRSLWVHEGVRIRKVTDIAYRMERMRMSAEERRTLAGNNMEFVLYQKYGPQWRELMYNGLVEDAWR